MVRYGDRSILFDTGGDGRMLLANMAALGFNPEELDAVVLSHAHSDHTGGLADLLGANPDVTVYARGLPGELQGSAAGLRRAGG
jgi:7,8-dihydropterin-6-yl-methyl-4-(beta-D-ribofuranosyl)aminobenzene 5'-phosphate synthase